MSMSNPSRDPSVAATINEAPELAWDQRILALLPSSVDLGQLRENLRLTPTERVEQMLALVEFIESQGGRARVRAAPTR
jgi:hypothetical protein